MRRWLGWLVLCIGALLLGGCAGVTVSSISPSSYLAERRGDVLTTGPVHGLLKTVRRGYATTTTTPPSKPSHAC